MRLTVLGRSPARPNPGEACAGYLVEGGRSRVLLDVGPGVVAQLLRRNTPDELDAAFAHACGPVRAALPLIAIGFAAAMVAMAISTLNGLDRVPPVLIKVARIHRLGRLRTLFLVVVPSAAPALMTGMKLALAYAFISIIAGEFILSGKGLGYQIAYAYDSFDNKTMYGLMLFVLLVVTIMNTVLHMWEQRVLRRRSRA